MLAESHPEPPASLQNDQISQFAIYGNGTNLLVPSSECSICLDSLKVVDQKIAKLACDHFFHFPCLKKWIRTPTPASKLCPCCRHEIDEELIGRMSTIIERFVRDNHNRIKCAAYCSLVVVIGGLAIGEYFGMMAGANALGHDALNRQHTYLEACKEIQDEHQRQACLHSSDPTAKFEMTTANFIQPAYIVALVWRGCSRRRRENPPTGVSAYLPPILGCVWKGAAVSGNAVYQIGRATVETTADLGRRTWQHLPSFRNASAHEELDEIDLESGIYPRAPSDANARLNPLLSDEC
ncbi:MAG: hypothetical protein ACI9S8_000942 [Chlamydiales bacterium]|jgi:hypothetical protein